MASSQDEQVSQTENERLLNEELAKNPPAAGAHADAGAAQMVVNSLANSYPENDDADVVAARLKEGTDEEKQQAKVEKKAAKASKSSGSKSSK